MLLTIGDPAILITYRQVYRCQQLKPMGIHGLQNLRDEYPGVVYDCPVGSVPRLTLEFDLVRIGIALFLILYPWRPNILQNIK